MNKLLVNYIRRYLNESPLPYAGKEIGAKLQHELSPNISKDMTNLSDKAVIKTLMQSIDERTCISFVNEYDENIPSFNINPHASYKTPHGNYAYPLTLENLREIIYSKKVKGASFAIDRPYFLLFKVNSPNALIINKDGTTNYKSLRSTRRAMTRSKSITLDQDIDTVIRNFLYFVRTLQIENKKFQLWSSRDTDIFNRQLPHFCSLAEDKFEELANKDITIDNFFRRLGEVLRRFVFNFMSMRRKVPSSVENKFLNDFSVFFKEYLVELSESEINKFYDGEDTDDFHKIYFICWLLSNVGEISNQKQSNGPILTLLLRSIGLDAIIDQGSSTIHQSEPEQTVSLSFGNVKAKDIEFLGTFRNIFKDAKSKDYIEEIAAEIYKEEGFRYDTDFFDKDENPASNLAGSDVYVYLEDLLLSYSMNDTILNRGVKVEGDKIKVIFDLYADEIETDITDITHLIELIDNAILKSPHKDKIEVDLGVTIFEIENKVDLTKAIKTLFSIKSFDKFVENYCKDTLSLSDIPDYESNVFLNFDQELLTCLSHFFTKLVVDKTCSFVINFGKRYYLDEILKENDYIVIDKLANVTFNLLDMGHDLLPGMKATSDDNIKRINSRIIQKINNKYPNVKVVI